MKQIFTNYFLRSLVVLTVFVSTTSTLQAQVATNSGSGLAATYPSLAAAIAVLNGATISSPVTITLTGNEDAPAGGYSITAQGSSTNTITIEGSGSTITASTGHTAGALNDAIFKLVGADYVTLQNFTMQESGNNVTAAGTNNMTEWGVALLYATTTNGAQNNTIQNCTISLNRAYQNTFGIYANATHSPTAPSTSVSATTTAGGNSGLKIYGNTISNVNNGILVVGPLAAADYNTGIDIGGSGGSQANTITDFGTTGTFSSYVNVSGSVFGILVRNSVGFNISSNTITSSLGGITVGTLRGIYNPSASAALTALGAFTNVINNNTIALTFGAATSGTMHGISTEATNASATSVGFINGNNFTALTGTVSSPITILAITAATAHSEVRINSNKFTNITTNTTGGFTFISHIYTVPVGGNQYIRSNAIIGSFNKTGAGSTVACIASGSSTVGASIVQHINNNFSNITVTGVTTLSGIANSDGLSTLTYSRTVTGNTFSNWTGGSAAITAISYSYWGGTASTLSNNTITNITGQAAITGINLNASGNAANPLTISNNTISGLVSTATASGLVQGILCANTSPVININNNNINGLSSTGLNNLNGIQITGATQTNIFKNTICNLENTGLITTQFVNGIFLSNSLATVNVYNNRIADLRAPNANGTNAINGINANTTGATNNINVSNNTVYLNASSTGTDFGTSAMACSVVPTVTLRNNIFVNTSTNNGAGVAAAYKRNTLTTPTVATYGSASQRNCFFAPTLYTDGTTPLGFPAFKALVGPTRDANSLNMAPAFLSTTSGNPNFLKIDPAVASQLESAGANIAGITDDFEDEIRQGNAGYLAQVNGGGTAPDMGADEFDGIPAPVCNGTPAAANVVATASPLCSGSSTSLGLSTVYGELFITYQWQVASVAGGPYINMGIGATQATGALASTMYYKCVVTCTNSGMSFTTPEFMLTVNPTLATSITAAAPTVCAGATTTLTANSDSYNVTGMLSGAQEVPAVSPAGSGTVNAVYNGATNVLTLNVAYNGLTSAVTAANIHGPAASGATAAATLALPTTVVALGATSGNLTGTVTLTATDEANLYAGLLYVNIATANNTSGEVRAQLTAVVNTPATYAWAANATLSDATIQMPTATPTANTTYTVTVTNPSGCNATATKALVMANPIVISALAAPTLICSGGTATLTANASAPGGVINVGTATTTIGGANGNPYRSGTGAGLQVKTQMLYTAAELLAGGMQAGNVLGLGFTTTTTTGTLTNFEVKIGSSNATVLTATFETTPMTTVFTQATFTPVAGLNMHTFNGGTYTWDGVSNILVQTCQTNSVLGTSIVNAYTPTAITSASAQTLTTACASLTGNTNVLKPIIRFATSLPVTNLVWQPGSLVGSPQTVSPTATQVYTAVATDAFNCTASSTVTVTMSPLSCSPATVSPLNCAGSNFTVTANTTGGGAPLSYAWSDGSATVYANAPTITANLPAGTYTFTCAVTDACGSSCNSDVIVVVNALPPTAISPSTTLICATGSSVLTASGGASYVWASSNSLSATNIAAPTATPFVTTVYTVTATDATTGCTASATTSIAYSPPFTLTAPAPSPICEGGFATLNATGGGTGGDFNVGTSTTSIGGSNGNPYRSGNGNGYQIKTQLLYTQAELVAAGMVGGNVLGLGFTTSSATGTVVNFEIRVGNTSATALTTTFDTAPTTLVFTQSSFAPAAGLNMHTFNTGAFTWDGVSNILVQTCQTNSLSGTVTVLTYASAASNVSQQSSTTSCSSLIGVVNTSKPIIRFNMQPSPVTLAWQPGNLAGSPQVVQPIATQVYTVIATDLLGCTKSATVTATINTPTLTTADITNICPVTTANLNTGITSSITGLTVRFYTAADLATEITGTGITQAATGATYYVKVTNVTGCTATASFMATATACCTNPVVTNAITDVACFGGSTGSIALTQTGGDAITTYAWTGSASTAATATGLTVGTYEVTVTAAIGCSTVLSGIAVAQPTAALTLVATSTDNTACTTPDGTATFTAAGGTAPYTYATMAATAFMVDHVSVTAAHPNFGSTFPTVYTIDGVEGKELTLVRGVTYTFDATMVGGSHPFYITEDANGGGAGTQYTAPVSGGMVMFTPTAAMPNLLYYQCSNHANMGWKINLLTPTSTSNLTGLAAGSYTTIVTDNKGCMATATATVADDPTPPTATLTKSGNLNCTNLLTGVTLTAGAGAEYDFGTGFTATNTFTAMTATTYTVTVKAANGCTAATTIAVTSNTTAPVANVMGSFAFCTGANTTLIASPGFATYAWSDGTASTAPNKRLFTTAGTYSVTITGANGCTTVKTFTTVINSKPTLTGVSMPTVCAGSNLVGSVTVGSTLSATTTWAASGYTGTGTMITRPSATTAMSGLYIIRATNTCGTTSLSATATVKAIMPITVAVNNASTLGGSTGSIYVTAPAGSTFSWVGSAATTGVRTGLATGTYTVTVSPPLGSPYCPVTRSIVIN